MARKILIGVAALCVVVGILGVVVSRQPGTFTVQRSATMAAPPPRVFALVNDLRAWEVWSPWTERDPNSKQTISTPSDGQGARVAWSGNQEVGEGTMTIVESKPYVLVDFEQVFVRPLAGKARMRFTFAAAGGGTEVTWKLEGTNDFVGKAMCMVMDMDAILGKDFEHGLAHMKAVLENGETPRAAAAP